MLKSLDLRKIEFGLFLLFIFCIPSYEAPKNILVALFFLTWLYNRCVSQDWGGAWRFLDTVIVILLLTNVLVNAVSFMHGHGFAGVMDLTRYTCILWIITRTRFSQEQLRIIFITLLAATVYGLLFGFFKFYFMHSNWPRVHLNAVGESNHSAIYLVMSLAALLASIEVLWTKLSWWQRTGGLLLLVFFLVGLFFMESRAALGTAFLLALLFGVLFWKRSKRILLCTLLAFGVVAGGMAIVKPVIIHKQLAWQHDFDAKHNYPRINIWRVAIMSIEQHPIFGLGSHNYGLLTQSKIKQLALKYHGVYQPDLYEVAPHAHNLYLNTLAEMGVVGFIPLMLFLFTWLWMLFKYRPRKGDSSMHHIFWLSALSAWLVNVGIGFVNTTIHNCHALETMILLGVFVNYYQYHYSRH